MSKKIKVVKDVINNKEVLNDIYKLKGTLEKIIVERKIEEARNTMKFEKEMNILFIQMKSQVDKLNVIYDEIEDVIKDKSIDIKKSLIELLPWFIQDKVNKLKPENSEVMPDEELVKLLTIKQKAYQEAVDNMRKAESEIKSLLEYFYDNEEKYEYISSQLKIIPMCSEKFKLIDHLRKNYSKSISYISN